MDNLKAKKVRASKKVTIDYKNGKIYKLVNDINDMLYVGSTTTALAKRFSSHKCEATSLRTTTPLYVAMNNIGIDHFKIVLIEEFSCENKSQLEAKEYEIMNKLAKEKLFNSILNGKFSDESKQKMSEWQSGLLSAGFKRGSIYKNGNTYFFQWRINHRQTSKCFNFGNSRTIEQAYMDCINVQNMIYPLTHNDYAAELPFAED